MCLSLLIQNGGDIWFFCRFRTKGILVIKVCQTTSHLSILEVIIVPPSKIVGPFYFWMFQNVSPF